MENTNWLKQTKDKPLFPDLLWSRPENKRQAGKLLIIGGNSHGFNAPASAYSAALKAGIGTARVLLPNTLQKSVGKLFPEAEFAASTPSGSFARASLDYWLEVAAWADGVLLAGDFGHNSETAIVLESFLKKYSGPLTITGDAVDYFLKDPSPLNHVNTVMVADFSLLQKIAASAKPPAVLQHSMNLLNFVEVLSGWTDHMDFAVITNHSEQIEVSKGGQVATTTSTQSDLTAIAAHASVWHLQHPEQVFEALTTAVYCLLA
jgi:NAD(P)H-hydrate repair Nnr-like enzyme with NAD(P)H-hydrate dehydratase domain